MNIEQLVEKLLTEEKIDSANALFNIIKNKQIGFKLNPHFLSEIDLCKPEIIILYNTISKITSNIKFPIGFFLKQIYSREQLRDAIDNSIDCIKAFALNYNKPWVKSLKSYKALESNTMFKNSLWNNFKKEVEEKSLKHGSSAKGTSKAVVKPIYSDSDWELYRISSFEEAKKISYYGTNWDKPTGWCTRADKHYFERYTSEENEKYLWVIRSRDGHTWQLSFFKNRVEFMDEKDNRPSPLGIEKMLELLPDELCKKITSYSKKISLYDIKNNDKQSDNDGDSQVKIKLNSDGEISSMETPSDWGDIKTKNTKKKTFPFEQKDYENEFEISDIADIKVQYAYQKSDKLSDNSDISAVIKLIHAKLLKSRKDYYEIAVFNNKIQAEKFLYTSLEQSDKKLVAITKRFKLYTMDLRSDRKQAKYDDPAINAEEILKDKDAKIAKMINDKYQKVISQLPFGKFKKITKFTLNTKRAPNIQFGFNEVKKEFDNFKFTNIFPKKILVHFDNGYCYFNGDKMIFEPNVENVKEMEFEANSKETNIVKEMYKFWLKETFEQTKPLYNSYKQHLAKQQLESDHKAWKNGQARLRNIGRVYEEINNTSYFNY